MEPTMLKPLCFLCLLLPACKADQTTDDPSPTTPEVILPTEGQWIVNLHNNTDDPCSLNTADKLPFDLTDSTFELQAVTDSSFRLFIEEDLQTECTLNGLDFDCPGLTIENELSGGMSGTVTVTIRTFGTLTDADHFEATQTAEVTCTGADCATLDAFWHVTLPCTLTYDMNAAVDTE